MLSRTAPLCATLLVGLWTLSNTPAPDELDLSLRIEQGQSFTVSSTSELELVLDDLSVLIDGAEVLGAGVGYEMLMNIDERQTIDVMTMEEGDVTAFRRTLDEQRGRIEVSVDAMGNSDQFEESIDYPREGRTFEVRRGEDGEVSATDVSEGFEERLPRQTLPEAALRPLLDEFLPAEPVALGETFDLTGQWKRWVEALNEQGLGDLGGAGLTDEQIAALEGLSDTVGEALTVEAEGKVTSVVEGIATIEYEISGAMELEDLMALGAALLPQGTDLPPGIEASMLMGLELAGKGSFDLAAGQLIVLELEGEMSAELDGSADLDGTSAEAAAALSGTWRMRTEVGVD